MPPAVDQFGSFPGGRQPLCLLAAAVCAGILIDAALSPEPWWLWLLAAGIAGGGWLAAYRSASVALGTLALLALAACLGGSHHRCWWDLYPANSLAGFLPDEPTPTCLIGQIAQEPWWTLPDADPFDATPAGIRSTLVLAVTSVETASGSTPASGQIRVHVRGQVAGLQFGDRVRIWGHLQNTPPPGNPGDVDFVWYGRARRQPGLLSVDHPAAVQLLARRQHPAWLQAIVSARRRFDEAIWQYLPCHPELAAAVLLGLRGYVDDAARTDFLTTGTVHLLAISGLHVGILAASLIAIASLLGVGRVPRLLGTIAFVLLYAALVDFQPPVVRAAILISVWCLSTLFLRPASPANSLALSALLVLALDPTALFQVGAQLSFLAVFALWLAQPLCVRRRDLDPLAQVVAESRGWPARMALAGGEYFRELLIYSGFITLWTTPLVAYYFHLVAPVGLLVNPLLMFPIAVALKAGLATLFFAIWFPPAAYVCGAICDGSLGVIQLLVAGAARLPGGHWWTSGPSLAGVWLFYLIASGLWLARSRQWSWPAAAAWMLPLVLLAWLVPDRWPPARQPPQLVTTFIEVGHGGAALVQLPNGKTVLFDAGSLRPPNNTAQRVAGVLWYQRVEQLDLVLISHDDLDHYSAVDRLADRFTIREIGVTRQLLERPSPPLQELLRRVAARGIPLRTLAAGDYVDLDSAIEIRVLHPAANVSYASDNAASLVVEFSCGTQRLLLTADLEGAGLAEMMRQAAPRYAVAMLPHHGSRFSQPLQFSRWSQAAALVVCNDEFDPKLLGTARAQPPRPSVWVTGMDGAVRVETTQDHSHVQAWRRQPWGR